MPNFIRNCPHLLKQARVRIDQQRASLRAFPASWSKTARDDINERRALDALPESSAAAIERAIYAARSKHAPAVDLRLAWAGSDQEGIEFANQVRAALKIKGYYNIIVERSGETQATLAALGPNEKIFKQVFIVTFNLSR